jgi:putative hydrolase of the HAD superfamily
MHFVLIFDADNTLWDTNAVFHSAQVAMLETFETVDILSNARSQVERLRAIDRILIQRLERHEYDFRILATALGRVDELRL